MLLYAQESTLETTVLSAPDVFVVHINRFLAISQADGDAILRKSTAVVAFPFVLRMSEVFPSLSDRHVYDLVASVDHRGVSMAGGE